MILVALIISILSLLLSILVAWVVAVKIKSVYLNLYNMSKGLDTLWENQKKIIELTKIKGFVQLTNEEEQKVRKEISEEREKLKGIKKEPVQPSGSNSEV
jgi:5-bromo-4-chloroindolyl phosphate hydrolysis protein